MAIVCNGTRVLRIIANNTQPYDMYVGNTRVYGFFVGVNGHVPTSTQKYSLTARSADGSSVQFTATGSTGAMTADVPIYIYPPYDIWITSISYKFRQNTAYGGTAVYSKNSPSSKYYNREVSGSNWNNPLTVNVSTGFALTQSNPLVIIANVNKYNGDFYLEDVMLNGIRVCIE